MFDLDQWRAEHQRKPYRFRWGGQLWTLPHVHDLPDGPLDALAPLADLAETDHELTPQEIAGLREALRQAFGRQQWQQINDVEPLPVRVQFALFARWVEWCDASLGESDSSADSSPGTAGRSKRTSRGTTRSGSARRSTAAAKKTGARRAKS